MELLRDIWGVILETFARFDEDGIPRISAAMSYYLLLALAPLLLALNAILGLAGGKIALGSAGSNVADASAVAATAYAQVTAWAGSYAPYVTALIVLVGSVSVFGQFVGALQVIWKTPPHRTPIRAFLHHHGLSLALLVVAALALVVAIVLGGLILVFGSAALSYAQGMGVAISGVALVLIARGVFAFVIAALLFAVAFTVVPDRRIKWRDALPGALVTAVLFMVGELWLSYYLSATKQFSVFGTFQFFVVLIVWIYYSALVTLWGAELTRLLVLRAEAARVEPRQTQGDG
ncbi:MAG: YihY/virulence factor BrkB family protein [Coriobacteriia bacterium]|nr:YihY/virulence factor BrkB family protein [Coriobacteriia bacterium]